MCESWITTKPKDMQVEPSSQRRRLEEDNERRTYTHTHMEQTKATTEDHFLLCVWNEQLTKDMTHVEVEFRSIKTSVTSFSGFHISHELEVLKCLHSLSIFQRNVESLWFPFHFNVQWCIDLCAFIKTHVGIRNRRLQYCLSLPHSCHCVCRTTFGVTIRRSLIRPV